MFIVVFCYYGSNLVATRGWGGEPVKGRPDLLFLTILNTHTFFKLSMYTVHLGILGTNHNSTCISSYL